MSYVCFFKQKMACDMRMSEWSSDVCASDLLQRGGGRDVERLGRHRRRGTARIAILAGLGTGRSLAGAGAGLAACLTLDALHLARELAFRIDGIADGALQVAMARSEEHTSELQSLMRISYAVFCLKKKKKTNKPATARRDGNINILNLSCQ